MANPHVKEYVVTIKAKLFCFIPGRSVTILAGKKTWPPAALLVTD